jgi:hypothetical protein
MGNIAVYCAVVAIGHGVASASTGFYDLIIEKTRERKQQQQQIRRSPKKKTPSNSPIKDAVQK